MSDELVRVRDLKKIFSVPAGELHAVDGVDFSIARGSTIGIVGESGCGKSTMGRLLAMLLEATSGEILFDGQNIAKKDVQGRGNGIQKADPDDLSGPVFLSESPHDDL